MYYGIYKNVRNASWQCLIDCKTASLPLSISYICEFYNGKVLNNSDVDMLKKGESGRVYLIDGYPYVVVNDKENRKRIRFTIAHELGHYLLGHLGSDITKTNREYKNAKPIQETEADMFAARLLAPACVLWGIRANTAEQISTVCDISITAARYRADRMKVLYQRNMFLTLPLERQLYEQFEEYIRNNQLV